MQPIRIQLILLGNVNSSNALQEFWLAHGMGQLSSRIVRFHHTKILLLLLQTSLTACLTKYIWLK
jgi:hypothetical protein